MQGNESIPFLPLWGVFIVLLLLVLLSVEGGYQYAKYKRRSEKEKEAPVGAMVGATLGLLAFMLAFTFGMAADAFHARRQAVIDEANAIRTTYLLASVVSEPHRTEVRKILREYVEERLHWAGAEKIYRGHSAKELQNQLCAQTVVVGEKNPGLEVVALFIDSVNRLIDLHTERVMLRERSRIPFFFKFVLLVLAILAHAAMGYHGGVAGTNRSPVTLVVAIAFSIVIMVIADLDRPGEGWVNVSQQAMIDVRDWMAEWKL